MYDVLIIGAGVSGCSVARELSRYNLRIAVIEKAWDVAAGTSKANSAIVHAGYDAKPGTMKAKMNIAGNPMFDELSKELDFHFKRNGSLILCFDDESRPELQKLLERGEKNGVHGLRIIDREGLVRMEPNVGSKAVAALYAPSGGIVCPYEMTIALAENACRNGVEFFFAEPVNEIVKTGGGFIVKTPYKAFESRVIINAAGLFADEIHNMVSDEKIHIIPRTGQYCLLDKTAGGLVSHTLFQLPNEMGKGVLVTPTVDGNLLVGPTATDIEDKTDVSTSAEEYGNMLRAASLTLENIPVREIITAFSGLRAHSTVDDFIIGHVPGARGVIDVAGIESPGLTAAPAIGRYVSELAGELLELREDPEFVPVRRGIPRFREMNAGERGRLIAENPLYGHIICRCETVTEAEVLEAIRRPVGARDLDGVKRRVRAGMGRCQGGFCSPYILDILARELGLDPTEITKSGGDSFVLVGKNKMYGARKE